MKVRERRSRNCTHEQYKIQYRNSRNGNSCALRKRREKVWETYSGGRTSKRAQRPAQVVEKRKMIFAGIANMTCTGVFEVDEEIDEHDGSRPLYCSQPGLLCSYYAVDCFGCLQRSSVPDTWKYECCRSYIARKASNKTERIATV
jgi:hypothetical protein